MFHALRNWWSGGRGKTSARLFLFGFLVVMAGVLAAQALAGWIQHRGDLAAMETTRAQAEREVAFHYAAALGWKRAIPCLDERMTLLMTKAGSGAPIDSALLKRPAMESGNLQLMDSKQQLLLAERYGVERAQDYRAASQNVSRLADQVTDIIRAWSGFASVDPANGTVSDLDRHDARAAASSVKASLRAIDISSDNLIGRARAVNLQPNTQGEFRVISDCDDLWRSGKTHPDAGTKEAAIAAG